MAETTLLNPITDQATRRDLLKLHGAYSAAGIAILNAREDLAALEGKADALRERIRSEEAQKPAPIAASVDELAAALADNPAADIDGKVGAAALQRQAETSRLVIAWQARVDLLEAALAKLQAQITATDGKVEQLVQAESEARQVLIKALLDAMGQEILARWATLDVEVVQPFLALLQDPMTGAGNRHHFDQESRLLFREWRYDEQRGGSYQDHNLFRSGTTRREFDQPGEPDAAPLSATDRLDVLLDTIGTKR
jgi:hypothetical protein